MDLLIITIIMEPISLHYHLNQFFNRFSHFHSIIIILSLFQLNCEYLTDNNYNTQYRNITHGGSKYESEWFLVVYNGNDCLNYEYSEILGF